MHPRTTLALPILLQAFVAGCGGDSDSHEADAGRSEAGSGEHEDAALEADTDAGMDASEDASSASDAGAVRDGEPPADSALPAADADPKMQPIKIRFAGRVGAADFACGKSYPGQGSTSATITPVDFRFFVQDLKLVTPSGDEVPVNIDRRDPWQAEGVAMIDFEDATGACLGTAGTNREITGHVPVGAYVGVRFANGVPETLNHGELTTLPPVLQTPGMQWSWLLGFRFVKAEVLQVLEPSSDAGTHAADSGIDAGSDAGGDAGIAGPDAGSDPGPERGYAVVHTGAVACSGNPSAGNVRCSQPNRNALRFDNFDPERNVIVFDIGALFGETDLTKDVQCHSGAMDCSPMVRLGIDIKTGQPLATQQVYRVE